MWFLKISRTSVPMWGHNLRNPRFIPFRTYAEAGGPGDGNAKGRPSPVTEELKKNWKKVAPLLDFPRVPTNFMGARPAVPTTLPTRVTVNFVTPRKMILEAAQVDMVIIPATSGHMGVLPGHVPSIAELKPGILTVHEDTQVKKYMVSSGFAIVHANSITDLVAVEAVPLEDIDIEEAKKGLAEYTQKLNTANTDLEKAEAQIGVEVYGNLVGSMVT